MKKITLSLALAAVFVASCQKSETSLPVSEQYAAIVESFESQTKTSMTREKYVVWSQDDRIAIFRGATVAYEYKLNAQSAGTANGIFSREFPAGESDFVAGTEIPCNVAFYPYVDDLTLTGAALESEESVFKVENVVLPAEQTYVKGSFANGAFPMAAVTESYDDHTLVFKNVLGALKLQLKGTQTVKSITVTGKNNEVLSGAAEVMVYPGNLAPAIAMTATDEASKSVTLNCPDGVQLSEDTATDFIIALPPVLFSNGFSVIIIGDNQIFGVSADVANTVLRSSILTMPALTLGETSEDDVYISSISLDKGSLTMYPETSYTLVTDINPDDVTFSNLLWSSSDEAVATVDQTGKITTVADGTAVITVCAVGGASASCSVTVKSATSAEVIDYVVDGQNYGAGIKIGQTIWAPVNCGYEPALEGYKGYPYGKLYQWGRPYGQGYSTEYDATEPSKVQGPVEISVGLSVANSNNFYMNDSGSDWSNTQQDDLWGHGSSKKSEYDPCPAGWRVPTQDELSALIKNYSSWTTNSEGQNGRYLTGEYTYREDIPQTFFPAAGRREGSAAVYSRECSGNYWSVTPLSNVAHTIFLHNTSVQMSRESREYGCSVRCVQE